MCNFMCQLVSAMRCPDIRPNAILTVTVRGFLNEITIWI